MSETALPIPPERIERSILLIRGEKVMLESDLAELYGVETKALTVHIFARTGVLQAGLHRKGLLRESFFRSTQAGRGATNRVWPP
jgi:hypothetical protein